MLTATVPCDGGVLTELGESPLDGVGALLDGVNSEDLGLPCRAGNPDLWFAETPAELERAKVLCADCPIKAQCLEGALARREPWGVWGGEIFERGAVVARKRPRGRPRKSEVNPAEVNPAEQHPAADATRKNSNRDVAA